ncbi:MAG: hypothetical protein H0U21_12045 [Acidimicrobiia bacterium]|nr:hypothetical protein [Acidimicrobiia bacterium]
MRGGSTAPTVLRARLAALRGPGRWGARLLDELLLDSGGHTPIERRFLAIMRRAGLPRAATQIVHRRDRRTVARVDFSFDAYDLVVEVSGRVGHTSDAERARDAQRRNELQDLGRRVYECTRVQLDDEAGVVATMRSRLAAAGWRR